MKKHLIWALAALALTAISCNKPVTPDPGPEPEKTAPKILSASLRGAGGATEIIAGESAKFTASLENDNTGTLASYSLKVTHQGWTIAQSEGALAGNTANLDVDLVLDPGAITEAFYADVQLVVVNSNNLSASKTLSEAENVLIKPEPAPEKLYLVDNNSSVYEMALFSPGFYKTDADLAAIGTSFKVAEKVNGSSIDESGKVWGSFPVPDSESFGLLWLGFNIATQKVEKMINFTVVADITKMAEDYGNGVFWDMEFHKDCKVVFEGYGANAEEMVQKDRFDCFDGNTARYTGQTTKWEVYFIKSEKWLVLRDHWYTFGIKKCLWVTGANASLPMLPIGVRPLNWFAEAGELPTSSLSCVTKDGVIWEVLMYMKANFEIKVYDKRAWANEQQWTTITPNLFTITPMEADPETGKMDGNYGVAGPDFVEGYYTLKFNSDTNEAGLYSYE